jgi:hypothetical protein
MRPWRLRSPKHAHVQDPTNIQLLKELPFSKHEDSSPLSQSPPEVHIPNAYIPYIQSNTVLYT